MENQENNKMEIHTGWTEATTNISKAALSLIACLESGRNSWLEVQENGKQDFPIKKTNPLLDNPFNWTMSYGTPTSSKELESRRYFNDTEKELIFNWTGAFGTEEAIKIYEETGEITEGLLSSSGICHPVKKVDANKYRREIKKDNYEYGFWTTYWKPKNSIPCYVADDTVGNVYVVCYSETGIIDKSDALKKAANFLLEYAKK